MSGRDNSSVRLKVRIREKAFKYISPESARVLDLYCGSGVMYKNVWYRAGSYFGTDKNKTHTYTPTAKISAEKAVSNFNLDKFNIFDIDCYSCPWGVARKIAKTKANESYVLILTDGTSRGLINGISNKYIRDALNLNGITDVRFLGRYREYVIGQMYAWLDDCLIDGMKLKAVWYVDNYRQHPSQTRYSCLYIFRNGDILN